MMKRNILTVAVLVLLSGMYACKDTDAINEAIAAKKGIVHDSLATVLPNWESETIFINEDKTQIDIIVGDRTLYNAAPEEKAKKADELARMLLRIYGKDNFFEKGNLVVTKDVRNTAHEPKDGISTPMPIAQLKKQGY